jgi:hypothetical protein
MLVGTITYPESEPAPEASVDVLSENLTLLASSSVVYTC